MAGEVLALAAAALLTTEPTPGPIPPAPPAGIAPVEALELPPENLVRRLRDARILGLSGQPAAQIESLEATANAYPTAVLPLLAILEFHRAQRSPAPVLDEVRARLALRFVDADARSLVMAARVVLSDRRARTEDLTALAKSLEALASAPPVDERILETLLMVQDGANDLPGARATLERLLAIRRAPRWLDAGLSLTRRQEDIAGTVAFAREILALTPSDRWTRLALGNALARSGDAEAFAVAASLAGAKPDAEVAHSILLPLAWALRDLRRDAEAEKAFRQAAANDPDSAVARAALLRLYATPGEIASHEAALARSRAKQENPFELLSEGVRLLSAGEASQAAAVLERTVALASDDDIAWFDLGLAYLKLERWEDAERAFGRSAGLKGDRPETYVHRGRALAELGRCEEAIPILERALALRPESKGVHFLLWKCATAVGDTEKAERQLELHRKELAAGS